jgi:hypothetical protein
VLIPFLQEELDVLFHNLPNLSEFSRIVTNCPIQYHWAQPKLGSVLGGLDVNVRRLMILATEKEETMATDFQYGGHELIPSSLIVTRRVTDVKPRSDFNSPAR